MDYILSIEVDQDAPCPMEGDGQWTLVSFNRHSIHYDNPEKYLRVTNDGSRVVPADIGLASKMRAGLAFVLQYYEHGLGRYDIQGNGPQCQWDTTNFGGILIWNHNPKDMGSRTYADRQKDAESFLEEYNGWMNGDAYGYSLDDREGNIVDGCWGYIGTDYMSQEIATHFKEGDRVKLIGGADYALDIHLLPDGVEIVEDFDEVSV